MFYVACEIVWFNKPFKSRFPPKYLTTTTFLSALPDYNTNKEAIVSYPPILARHERFTKLVVRTYQKYDYLEFNYSVIVTVKQGDQLIGSQEVRRRRFVFF